jgi:hypothetical protein
MPFRRHIYLLGGVLSRSHWCWLRVHLEQQTIYLSLRAKAIWVVAAGVLLTSCGNPAAPSGLGDGASASYPSGNTVQSLAPLEAPPESIPNAVLSPGSGPVQSGVPIASDWPAEDGRQVQVEPSSPVPWPTPIPQPIGGHAVVSIANSAMPARIEVHTFSTIDPATGVPEDDGTVTRCRALVSDGDGCSASRGPNQIIVDLPNELNRFMILDVAWFVPVELRPQTQQDVSVRSASYAFTMSF